MRADTQLRPCVMRCAPLLISKRGVAGKRCGKRGECSILGNNESRTSSPRDLAARGKEWRCRQTSKREKSYSDMPRLIAKSSLPKVPPWPEIMPVLSSIKAASNKMLTQVRKFLHLRSISCSLHRPRYWPCLQLRRRSSKWFPYF